MKRYVDGFVLPVPKKKLATYMTMASKAGKMWIKYGALQYFECAGDDLAPKMEGMKIMTFPQIVKTKPGETVLFSFIVFKSRAHRDKVNAKVMKEMMNDPTCKDTQMPFDVKRMVYGGFETIVSM